MIGNLIDSINLNIPFKVRRWKQFINCKLAYIYICKFCLSTNQCIFTAIMLQYSVLIRQRCFIESHIDTINLDCSFKVRKCVERIEKLSDGIYKCEFCLYPHFILWFTAVWTNDSII